MVKKDLERAGIPYETPEGIVDFHAAARHSHITGLIRSGASIMGAKELARHADIRQTAKYTHIGMEDRAEASGNLPLPIECDPRSEAKNHDRACVPRWSWSMTLIARSFPSGGYLRDRKQKTKADSAQPLAGMGGQCTSAGHVVRPRPLVRATQVHMVGTLLHVARAIAGQQQGGVLEPEVAVVRRAVLQGPCVTIGGPGGA
jgi:hypothetical protein